MKGKKCFGVLLLFSITFLLSLNVFSDTNAISLITSVLPTGRTAEVNANNVTCLVSDLTDPQAVQQVGQIGSMGECILGTSPDTPIALESFYVNQPITVRQGYYYNVLLGYQTIFTMNDVLWHPSVPANGIWRFVEMQEVTHDEFISGCLRWRPVSYPADVNTPDYCEQFYTGSSGSSNYTYGSGWKTTWYSVTLMALEDSDSAYFYLGNPARQPRSFLVGRGGQVFMSNIVEYYPTGTAEQEMNEKDNEDRSNIESQSSEASTDSDSSSQDITDSASNFIDYVGGIVGVISAPATDCKINMDLGNLNMGEVDLCTLNLPPQFQVIGSILLIGFVVPLAWATLNKIIQLIRSFQ